MEITTNGKTIWVNKSCIRAMIRNDLDNAQKNAHMHTFWLIAKANGMVDDAGNLSEP